MLAELRSKRRNAKIFEKISNGVKDRGYNRNPQQCRVKIKELGQAYQKTREANGSSFSEPQTCRFYEELHAILGGAATTTPTLCFDSVQGVGGDTEAGFGGEEDDDDEEEEVVDSSQQGSRETGFPNSQDLFITLDLDPVPPEPTQEESEAAVESDSHLEMEGELSDTELLETVVAIKHQLAEEAQEDSASDDEPEELCLTEQLCVVGIFQEMEGELSDTELLETVVAIKHQLAEEAQEDSASDDEPEELCLTEQLCVVGIFHRICQSLGFENSSEPAHKIEKDLQEEVTKCKK
ncbi:hypothetical protein UY3_15101 [Chelonia mydas]|uniref:Myb/SANT-like DNA-binding domain-containing protein n=1 Tax=Chelonia mydas TaxID=8469 RepID=M7AXN2_CHEMY|nr:hypothetical protein UY3_15101 [Chelonia mydas]